MSQRNIDSNNLHIRTKAVQKMLEPLILNVTALVDRHGSTKSKKGKSKNISVLCINLRQAIATYIQHGQEIANDHPEIANEIHVVLDDIASNGEKLNKVSLDFASEPCSASKKKLMVKQAQILLTDVTKLLILADMVDVNVLMSHLQRVQHNVDLMTNVKDEQQLVGQFRNLDQSIGEMDQRAFFRQEDLLNDVKRHEMAAARALLKKSKIILLTSTKTHLNHLDLAAARENRDRVHRQVCSAVDAIAAVARSNNAFDVNSDGTESKRLAKDLDKFDRMIVVDPMSYDDSKTRSLLEQALENIISQSAHIADSNGTRDLRKERIIDECKQLRSALQNLLSEYLRSSHTGVNERLDYTRDAVCMKTFGLRKQLRRAVTDHVSDTFVDVEEPLGYLVSRARSGDLPGVEKAAVPFQDHVFSIAQVAELVCNMSTNEVGVRTIQVAAAGLLQLSPQVVLAARILAARPQSIHAQENMEVHVNAWTEQVRLLTDAVDDVMVLDDFLAITENHLQEDIGNLVNALRSGNWKGLDQTTQLMTLRCGRVHDLVTWEMANRDPGPYTEQVQQTLMVLRDQIVLKFMGISKQASSILSGSLNGPIPDEQLIRSANQVQEGVRNIRKAVLNIPINGEIDSDIDDDNAFEVKSRALDYGQVLPHEQDNQVFEEDEDRALMRALPEEERTKIQQQVQLFRMEKAKLDKEMEKWDETGNDVIIIAKRMCMIMMGMTDFMRGMGRLKTTIDVINAAKEISDHGSQLDRLCRQIALQCQDSVTKRDLIAYLERIHLHCHQLNITSKVKKDLQAFGEDKFTVALENATTLIQAAKNLMNAVVMAIRASYVASTKYPKSEASATITWKMKAPSKKPLVHRDQLEDPRASIRKGEQKKSLEPIKALSEFHS